MMKLQYENIKLYIIKRRNGVQGFSDKSGIKSAQW